MSYNLQGVSAMEKGKVWPIWWQVSGDGEGMKDAVVVQKKDVRKEEVVQEEEERRDVEVMEDVVQASKQARGLRLR